MSLTEFEIKQAKPKDKRHFLSDGRGLILEIKPNGKKFWIVRCYSDNKERRKYIGEYPTVSLKEAREIAVPTKKKVINSPERKEEIKFRDVCDEWFKTRILPDKSETYTSKLKIRLEKHILPAIGNKRLTEISSQIVLGICRTPEALGQVETAHRIKQIIGQVFRYAIACGQADNDPTSPLKGALKPKKYTHYATVTKTSEIGVLMRNIAAYPQEITRIAILFSALTFCRPGEVRHAEWSEIDWDRNEWRIPAEKMKMRRVHIVPLATQTMSLLSQLRPLTEKFGKWLFPAARLNGKPMSENTVRIALRGMGYTNEQMTPHGFRAMASTTLNENDWSSDVIERQLAHSEQNSIRAAYNHAEHLPKRREMMQWWADYLEELAKSKD